MSTNKREVNYFVRTMLVIFGIALCAIVGFSFFYFEPKGVISPELITLILIILVIVLAESFDNFSLGKLFTISRDVKKKETDNQVLEVRNKELLNQIISITTNQSQTQTHTNVYGDYVENAKEQKANEQENKSDTEEVDKLLTAIGSSIVIDVQVKAIEKDLKDKNINYDNDASKILIRHLAASQLLVGFEQIYHVIFGSQIELLQNLNQVTGKGITKDLVSEFVTEKLIKNNLSWEESQYLNYLYTRLLIVDSAEGDSLHITNLGVEFLTWLTRSGKSLNRVL
ncbi:hypothetical protein L4C31_00855 [Aliivibrio sifiae]